MKHPRLLALLLACIALLPALSAGPRIILVGDSTVADGGGWGLGFRQFITDDVDLVNAARNGRSSMSFIKEGLWEQALALRGDYYLIQFGHNDEPGKPGRSTTEEEYRAYLERYIDETRAIGATPVLVTSLVRRQFRDRDNPHLISSSLQSRAEIMRAIARERNVPLVELHNRSKELCERLGRDGCLFFSPVKEDGSYDGTHLKPEGFVLFARLVVDELRTAVPALARHLLPEPRNPLPSAAEAAYDAVVAFDGSGTHTTVQAAIDAAPTTATAAKPFRILLKSGTYREHVRIPADKPFILLTGEPGEATRTVITMDTHVKTPDPRNPGANLSTPDSATVLVDAPDFTAAHITFENTTTREQRVQALALYLRGDRAVFRNCRFLGWQDTLRVDAFRDQPGRSYYRDCYIEGHVDYFYAAGTAVFDHCHIHSLADGYITAASTPESVPYGYVFLDCKVTAGPDVVKGFYLGRPWRPFASVAFIRCELPAQVRPEGWDNWRKVENESTARFAEFGNTGPGADTSRRVPWARQLTAAEAATFTIENILSGPDNWNPLLR